MTELSEGLLDRLWFASRIARGARPDLGTYADFWRLIAEMNAAEQAALDDIRQGLLDAYDETVERLATATGTWDIRQAQEIIVELERQLALWEGIASAIIDNLLGLSWTHGGQLPAAAFRASRIELSAQPFISTEMLRISQTTLPVLIKGISSDTTMRIARILRASIMAQETPFEAIQRIGGPPPAKILRLGPGGELPAGYRAIRSGPFGPIRRPGMRTLPGYVGPTIAGLIGRTGAFPTAFHRAEAIVRTEVGRTMSEANFRTLDEISAQMADIVGPMQKEWNATLDARTRPEHAAAHGQRVPVDKPFTVGGEQLMYPNDPRGSAGNVINCRCVMLPWHPMFEEEGGE
jgi:hypothetical protein